MGDYWFQNTYMALNKEKSSKAALFHCVVYMLPYIFMSLLVPGVAPVSIAAGLVMFVTHFFIDRFALMKNLCTWANGFKDNEYVPESVKIWIPIVWDNTAHIVINGLALTCL
jgi:hypothetical protein